MWGRRNLRISVDRIQLEVRPRTNDLDLVSPKHEPITTQWFQAAEKDVVIDVGAHIGRYTLIAAERGAKVIAIEPDPSNFLVLEQNVRLNGFSNVVLVNEAMTSTPGLLVLSKAGLFNTGTSSVRAANANAPTTHQERSEVYVQGGTLDGIVQAYSLTRIDWLKIDVEGHEIAVLEGALAALSVTRSLILEVTESTKEACKRIVEENGFSLVAIEEGDPATNWLLVNRTLSS